MYIVYSFEEVAENSVRCLNGHLLCGQCAERWSAQKMIEFWQRLSERRSELLTQLDKCDLDIRALDHMRQAAADFLHQYEDVLNQAAEELREQYNVICLHLLELERSRTDETEMIRHVTCPLCRVGGGFSPRPVD